MKKNMGFGVVGAILVVIVVLVVGTVVWRVYDASRNDSTQQNGASQNNPSSSQASAGSYLDIKELGVKIKLDDKNSNISYVSAHSSNDEAVYIINSDMKAIDEGNQYCAGANPGIIGLLDRSKDAMHWGETPISVDNTKSFKISDYYYVFRGPQSECSQDSGISQKRVGYMQTFLSILNTIQAD